MGGNTSLNSGDMLYCPLMPKRTLCCVASAFIARNNYFHVNTCGRTNRIVTLLKGCCSCTYSLCCSFLHHHDGITRFQLRVDVSQSPNYRSIFLSLISHSWLAPYVPLSISRRYCCCCCRRRLRLKPSR